MVSRNASSALHTCKRHVDRMQAPCTAAGPHQSPVSGQRQEELLRQMRMILHFNACTGLLVYIATVPASARYNVLWCFATAVQSSDGHQAGSIEQSRVYAPATLPL